MKTIKTNKIVGLYVMEQVKQNGAVSVADLAKHISKKILDEIFDQNDLSFIDDACLSYVHNFGLMSEKHKSEIRYQLKEWMRSMANNIKIE